MKLLASLIFFTRLPFWKIADVPPVYFKRVVDYWPFVGWLTGGIMAGTLWITAEFLPVQIAVLMALAARLLVTGALHEDGLADFCDGFGGGTSRDKILSIMKDSHIGTYGAEMPGASFVPHKSSTRFHTPVKKKNRKQKSYMTV